MNEGTVMQRGREEAKQAGIEAEVGQSAQDNNPMTILKIINKINHAEKKRSRNQIATKTIPLVKTSNSYPIL